jgi:hypothetical protein
MNLILISLLMSISILNLPGQQEIITEVRFESFSRAFQKTVIIRPDSIFLEQQQARANGRRIAKAHSPEQWEALLAALPDMPLDELSTLEAPSMERASDRASHSILTIKTDKNEYRSQEFDDYRPHKKLVPLVEQIREMEEMSGPAD